MGAHVRSPITKRKGSCRKKTFAMDPDEKAARALSHESAVARKACMPVGEDVIGNLDGADQIPKISRERFAGVYVLQAHGSGYGHVLAGI